MPEFTARFASSAEIADWDDHVIANPNGGNLLQSAAFAATKSQHGWKPRYLVFEGDGIASYNLVLEKSFPVQGRLWYLIKGPDVANVEQIPGMMTALRRFLKAAQLGVFAVKIEPDVIDTPAAHQMLAGSGLIRTYPLQPNDHTAILDVSPDSNQLLRNLHSRGRNAIRRAEREGTTVVPVELTEANMRAMYELMSGTIAAKGTATLRSFDYYRQFWTEFAKRGQGQLYFVYEDGKPSVGAYVIGYGRKGTYKDGGSLIKRNQYGDSHLVQWVAINTLKAQGITEYDFCGTPPADRLKDPTHPLHGLGMFKTSFTKTITDFVGCYDLVLNPLKYKAWNVAGERVFRQLYTRRTGGQFY